jgi:hypothetical protein
MGYKRAVRGQNEEGVDSQKRLPANKKAGTSMAGREPMSSAAETAKTDCHRCPAGGALTYRAHWLRKASALASTMSRMPLSTLRGGDESGTSTTQVPPATVERFDALADATDELPLTAEALAFSRV